MLTRQNQLLCCCAHRGVMGVRDLLRSESWHIISGNNWKSCLNYHKDSCALLKRISLWFSPQGDNKIYEDKTVKITWYEPGKSGSGGLIFAWFLSCIWAECGPLQSALINTV